MAKYGGYNEDVLPLQLPYAPILLSAFNLIKIVFFCIFNAHEYKIMRPR